MAKGKVVLGGQAQKKSKVNLATAFGISGGSSGGKKTGGVTTTLKGKKSYTVASAKSKVSG